MTFASLTVVAWLFPKPASAEFSVRTSTLTVHYRTIQKQKVSPDSVDLISATPGALLFGTAEKLWILEKGKQPQVIDPLGGLLSSGQHIEMICAAKDQFYLVVKGPQPESDPPGAGRGSYQAPPEIGPVFAHGCI